MTLHISGFFRLLGFTKGSVVDSDSCCIISQVFVNFQWLTIAADDSNMKCDACYISVGGCWAKLAFLIALFNSC